MRPVTLFTRTARTILFVVLAVQAAAVAATVYFMTMPMARRSADDLASLIVLSAQTWAELPPNTRPVFEEDLARRHDLWLFVADSPLDAVGHRYFPYLHFLEAALAARFGRQIPVKVTDWDEHWFWAEIPAGGRLIRVGFPASRLGVRPPLALVLTLVVGLVLTVGTALVLVRRVTRPLAQLSEAAEQVGRGALPERLPESGPQEFAVFARTFNRMAQQVRSLLANRTVLLSGISHDLRTPLARMRLAVEMLPAQTDPKQIRRLQRDLDQMNELIGAYLQLSRELSEEAREEIDLAALVGEVVAEAREAFPDIDWLPPAPAAVFEARRLALKRVLANLLGNAARYGAGQPVRVELEPGGDRHVIRVLDRGPGIPADKLEQVFEPFYRLESSRSAATGGSGLGLALSRQLAEANGWRIELAPREGGGTEARLTLPR